MSGKPAPRSATVEKYKKYDDPTKFFPENVIIDEQTKSPRYLTSYSRNGMRKLIPIEKRQYEAYLKAKESSEVRHEYFQGGKDIKVDNPHAAKQERQGRLHIQEDNYYQTNELIKNKIGGAAQREKHKKYFRQNDDKKYEIGKYKKDAEVLAMKKSEIKEEENKDEIIDDPLVKSTLRIAGLAMEQLKSKEEETDEIPKRSYFEKKFATMQEQMASKLGEFMQMLEKQKSQKKIEEKLVPHESHSQYRVRTQLRELLLTNSNLEREKNTLQANHQILQAKYKDSEEKRREAQQKVQQYTKSLELYNAKLHEIRGKYNNVCVMYEQLQRKTSNKAVQVAKSSQNFGRKPLEIKFCSLLAIENNVTSLIREPIESLTKKRVKTSKLIYQKDDFNTNITNYLDRPPFPLVILFNTTKNNTFGVFAQGIQSYRTNQMKESKTFDKPFKVFLFNTNIKMLFYRQQESKATCGLSYFENHLKFGNNELILKNNALSQIKIQGSSVFGQKYFYLPKRQHLTGEQADLIEIKELQIFQVILSDT